MTTEMEWIKMPASCATRLQNCSCCEERGYVFYLQISCRLHWSSTFQEF